MRVWFILIAGLVAGCGTVSGEANMATIAAQNRGFVTEAAQINGTIAAQETSVLATSVAAETLVARENVVNAIILETVRAGEPPTVAVVARIDRSAGRAAGATPDPNQFGDEAAGTVAETYVTSAIRDADGCGVDRVTQFPAGTSRLFAVQRYQSIPANTLVSIDFFFEGAQAFSDDLVVTGDETDFCVWFFLEPYSQGQWALQFYSNGNPIGERVSFSVGG